jgi:hypothetical protein
MARAVRGVRRRWREEHHPRNPNNGKFVRKGSPEAAAWAVRLSEKAGEHRERMGELHPPGEGQQRWAGLLSDKAEQRLTPEQRGSVERLRKKGAPVSVLSPVSGRSAEPRFKAGDLITNGSSVGTVLERVEQGPRGQGPGVRIQNSSLERFGGNRGMSSFVPDTGSSGWKKVTPGEWRPVKGGGLEERFVWSSDHSRLRREVRSTAPPNLRQASGSKPVTHSDLWRTTSDPDRTRAEGLKPAQMGWEGGGSYFGEGVYLHTGKADSDRFAVGERMFGSGRAEQLPAQASVTNPFVVSARPDDEDARVVMQRALEQAGVVRPGERVSVQEFTRRLKARGHDGVEVRGAEGNDHLAGNQLVVFDPADAKLKAASRVDKEPATRYTGGEPPRRAGQTPGGTMKPGKKIPARGAPTGYEVRDNGDTDYAGKPIYQVYGPDGNKVGTLTKTTQNSQILSQTGNISLGTKTRKGYRFAPGDTLPDSSSSLRPTVGDAITDYERNIKPHYDKYRAMDDEELAEARTQMARQFNTFHTNVIKAVQRERRNVAAGGDTAITAAPPRQAPGSKPAGLPDNARPAKSADGNTIGYTAKRTVQTYQRGVVGSQTAKTEYVLYDPQGRKVGRVDRPSDAEFEMGRLQRLGLLPKT